MTPTPQHLVLRIDPSQAPDVVRMMLANESCDELWINPWPPRASDSPEIEFTICGGDERHVTYLESRGISVFAWKVVPLEPITQEDLGRLNAGTGFATPRLRRRRPRR